MRGIRLSGSRIKLQRKSLGLTQLNLALRSNCDTKTIRKAERSKRVDLATAARIASALGAVVSDLAEPLSLDLHQANIRAAEKWVEAFNVRDPDAVANCFDEQGAVNVLADRSTPGAGEYLGKSQIKDWARICFETFLAQAVTREMYLIDAVGNYVFVRVDSPLVKCLKNGEQTKVSVMWEFKINAGKIELLTIYPQSGAIEGIFHRSSPKKSHD